MMKSMLFAFLTPVLALGAVVPGTWCDYYLDAREHSDANLLPMVYVWSSYERDGSKCHYCASLETALDTPEVRAWMAEKGFVFCHTWADNGKDVGERNEGAFAFVSTAGGKASKTTAWPIVCLYWPTGDGKFEAVNFVGRSRKMPVTDGGLAEQFMASVDLYFKDYVADPSGRFLCGKTAYDRLEAEERTASVEVPLVRTDVASTRATENRLVATWPDGTELTNEVAWAVGQAQQAVSVAMSGTFAAGTNVVLSLFNAAGICVDRSLIALVADKENSPANPLWIGERTAATLQAGEWTMDLEAAQRRSSDLKKNTLIIVAGSKWCPDCVNTDKNLIDTEVFRTWASENGVSCVAIDEPMMGSDCPSLLSPKAYDCSWLFGMTSGAEYLSRKGVPLTGNGGTNATAVAARNHDLLYNDTQHGGLCRPECREDTNPETSKFRTGIPCLILQDSSARILGRLYQFNNVSPTDTSAAAAYVQRLRELAALEGDGTEELNRHWSTVSGPACQLAANGTAAQSDISAIDTSDYWKLTGIGTWVRGTLSVKGLRQTGTAGEQNVRLVVWKVSNGTATKVTSKMGNLYTGFSLSNVQMTATDDWFVQLESIETSAAFALEASFDSRVEYSLEFTTVADPGTAAFVTTAATVKEADAKGTGGVAEIRAVVSRTGGGSGVLNVPVMLDKATTAETDRFALLDETVTWEDSDMSDKVVRISVFDDANADGTQTAVFRIGESTFSLTIIDNDKAAPGKLSIAACKPAIAKSRTVIATEGDEVRIGIGRTGGASGLVAGGLSATAGAFEGASSFSWENRQSDIRWCVLRLPSLDEAPSSGKIQVTLVPASGTSVNSSSKKLDIQLVAVDAPGFVEEQVSLSATRYVTLSRTVGLCNVKGLTDVKVKKLSGSIPAGVKLSVSDGQVCFEGTPTGKAGPYSAVYQVSAKKDRKTISGKTLFISFNMADFTTLPEKDPGANPAVSEGLEVSSLTMLDEATHSLIGQIENLSISARGKLSAKYACPEGKISLKSAGWTTYDSANGGLVAELTATKTAHRLTVSVARDGVVTATLFDPAWPAGEIVAVQSTDWSAVSGGARDWEGVYTVDFHSPTFRCGNAEVAALGDPVATLSMTSSSDVKKGMVKYAFVLPDGTGVSGSAALVRIDQDSAVLPVYKQSSKYTFFAAPCILSGRPKQAVRDWDRVIPRWRHVETKADAASYEFSYLTAGSAYDPDADLRELALAAQGTDVRLLTTSGCLAPVEAVIEQKKVDFDAPDGSSLKLKLTKGSGLVSGSFKFRDASDTLRSVTFKGVLLPDWDGCPNCGERPWAAGSFWYSDKVTVPVGGKDKKLSVKRGDLFMIEAELAQ